MELFLFTSFFPYKRAEPFLVTEFEFAKQQSNHITLFPLFGLGSERLFAEDEKVKFVSPVFSSPKKTGQIFFKGMFNSAPFKHHFNELFTKGIWFSPKKLYWLCVSFCVSRAVMSSASYRLVIDKIKTAKDPVLYFYWGDNLCWTIPYLKYQLKCTKIKIVVRLHGSDLYEQVKADYAPLREAVFSAADLVVPISKHGADYLKARYPALENKIRVSRLGVDDRGLNPFSYGTTFNMLSVSNLVALKRVPLIFEILQKVNLPIVWHHFGDGPGMDELKAMTAQARPGLKVVLHGHKKQAELMAFYKSQSLNVFINASASEGLPVSIMEALSFGVPVIATDVGGTSELVSERVGELVDKNFDQARVVEQLTRLLKLDPERTNALRANARNTFLEKVQASKNYELFYRKLNELSKGS